MIKNKYRLIKINRQLTIADHRSNKTKQLTKNQIKATRLYVSITAENLKY